MLIKIPCIKRAHAEMMNMLSETAPVFQGPYNLLLSRQQLNRSLPPEIVKSRKSRPLVLVMYVLVPDTKIPFSFSFNSGRIVHSIFSPPPGFNKGGGENGRRLKWMFSYFMSHLCMCISDMYE